MICLLNLFCCCEYLLCIVFTRAQKKIFVQKQVSSTSKDKFMQQRNKLFILFHFLASL
jgi:hypothetical protein